MNPVPECRERSRTKFSNTLSLFSKPNLGAARGGVVRQGKTAIQKFWNHDLKSREGLCDQPTVARQRKYIVWLLAILTLSATI